MDQCERIGAFRVQSNAKRLRIEQSFRTSAGWAGVVGVCLVGCTIFLGDLIHFTVVEEGASLFGWLWLVPLGAVALGSLYYAFSSFRVDVFEFDRERGTLRWHRPRNEPEQTIPLANISRVDIGRKKGWSEYDEEFVTYDVWIRTTQRDIPLVRTEDHNAKNCSEAVAKKMQQKLRRFLESR